MQRVQAVTGRAPYSRVRFCDPTVYSAQVIAESRTNRSPTGRLPSKDKFVPLPETTKKMPTRVIMIPDQTPIPCRSLFNVVASNNVQTGTVARMSDEFPARVLSIP